MATPAQILASQSNAQQKAQSPAPGRAFCAIKQSTGPVTAEGKARVSQNAVKLGLFSTANFVRSDEREEFEQFKADHAAELCPQTPLEETLAREIIHASWRLRRCALVEENPPEDATEQELDRLQASIDRARASAQRSLHRSLAELRRVQTERVYREIALPAGLEPENPGQADCRRLDPPALFIQQVKAADAQLMNDVLTAAEADFAKQTQSRPAARRSNGDELLGPAREVDCAVPGPKHRPEAGRIPDFIRG